MKVVGLRIFPLAHTTSVSSVQVHLFPFSSSRFSSCPCFGDLRVIWVTVLVLVRAPSGPKEEKTRMELVLYVRCFRSLRQRRRRPHWLGWNEELSVFPANVACGSHCCFVSPHHDGKEPWFCLSTATRWSVNSKFNGMLQREISSSS